jgi:RES domain-containing protein
VTLTLWRSVRRVHADTAFSGEAAAQFPGRYNAAGVRAVYLADCPAGCALDFVAHYAAPEAIRTHVLFEVEVDAPLVDLRRPQVLRRYGVSLSALTVADDYAAPRALAARLLAAGQAGAVVPAATVARSYNVVIYPAVWSRFVVHDPVPLAVDPRVLDRFGAPAAF